jgi:hypothetical protein
MCPFCKRDAPIVYRGAIPHCTACGALRLPLSEPAVNLAGKPAKLGGAVASVFGWLALLVGLSSALGVGLLLYALTTTAVALAVASPVALVTLVIGFFLVRGGRSMSRAGADVERSTHEQALLALAAHRGAVTAAHAAEALGLPVAEADALLTELAKRQPDRITLDIDEQGTVWYRALGAPPAVDPRVRVDESVPLPSPPARVDASTAEPTEGEEVDVDESSGSVGLRR